MMGAGYLAIQEVNAIAEMSAGQIETIAGQVLRTTDREHPSKGYTLIGIVNERILVRITDLTVHPCQRASPPVFRTL